MDKTIATISPVDNVDESLDDAAGPETTRVKVYVKLLCFRYTNNLKYHRNKQN